MRQLRSALARCLMVWLVAVFVTGAFGMGTAGASSDPKPANMTEHMAQYGSDCPATGETQAPPMHEGHAACKMMLCCVSHAPDFVTPQPSFEMMPASYALTVKPGLTQAEPERLKKPPRQS